MGPRFEGCEERTDMGGEGEEDQSLRSGNWPEFCFPKCACFWALRLTLRVTELPYLFCFVALKVLARAFAETGCVEEKVLRS